MYCTVRYTVEEGFNSSIEAERWEEPDAIGHLRYWYYSGLKQEIALNAFGLHSGLETGEMNA